MNFIIHSILLSLVSVHGHPHMEMTSPVIPKSQYDSSLKWFNKDYTNIFPIGNRYNQDLPFCHHSLVKARSTTIEAGSTYVTKFKGPAQHDGGHCEFSLSYDGDNFAVIRTIISECMRSSTSIPIIIPKEAPSGSAVLSWTWVNRIGERELYMSCAKINITNGPKSGTIVGPKRLIVNLPGYPTISQFKFSVKGVHFYRNRTSIVTGLDEHGSPTFQELDNTEAKLLTGKDYFYDPSQPDLDPTEGYPNTGIDENEDD